MTAHSQTFTAGARVDTLDAMPTTRHHVHHWHRVAINERVERACCMCVTREDYLQEIVGLPVAVEMALL